MSKLGLTYISPYGTIPVEAWQSGLMLSPEKRLVLREKDPGVRIPLLIQGRHGNVLPLFVLCVDSTLNRLSPGKSRGVSLYIVEGYGQEQQAGGGWQDPGRSHCRRTGKKVSLTFATPSTAGERPASTGNGRRARGTSPQTASEQLSMPVGSPEGFDASGEAPA